MDSMRHTITKVTNATFHYTDPATGEIKEKYIGDGTYEEVQAKIEAFKKELEGEKG